MLRYLYEKRSVSFGHNKHIGRDIYKSGSMQDLDPDMLKDTSDVRSRIKRRISVGSP
jgi:hypothetical protein